MQYKTGTADFRNGVATISFTGTELLSNISVGDIIAKRGERASYTIGAVTSDTLVTLTSSYAGSTAVGSDYEIISDFTPYNNLTEISAGDKDWAWHLTNGVIRKIDNFLGAVSTISAIAATTITAVNAIISSLTNGYIPKAGSGGILGNSVIYTDGTNIGVGVTSLSNKLEVNGNIKATTAKLTGLTDGYVPKHTSDTTGLENSNIYQSGTNVGIGQTSFGTSAAKVLGIGSGTAPTTSPADAAQAWTEDHNAQAGYARLHERTEDGKSAPIALLSEVETYKNPLAFAQGIYLTASATVGGIQIADNNNLDNGTNNFTIGVVCSLPDWTPSTADVQLIRKWATNVGVFLAVDSSVGTQGRLRLRLLGTDYYSTLSNTFTDKTKHFILASVTRESASTAGSITFYVDGYQFGSSVAIPAGAPSTISNSEILYLMGYLSTRFEGTIHNVYMFNYALTAAEVLSLYKNGIDYADKWGSQTAVYTSDFSAGFDSFTATFGAVAGNIDSIGGEDNWLRYTCNNTNNVHRINRSIPTRTYGKKYRVDFRYYIPSGQSNVDGIRVKDDGATAPFISDTTYNTLDAATSASFEFTAIDGSAGIRFAAMDGSAETFQDAGGDDLFYVKDVYIYEIGATLALEPEGIQPAPGQWFDSSSNKLHAWQPATGSSLTRYKNTFEIRGINTWSGTHEAQSLGRTTDVSQAVLPTACYITDIIGSVQGPNIEDIIIGDGSDTDRWVTLTSGLAAGTQSFTSANRYSDGTNYEMVVDPDAACTMTIAWTVRGILLQ